MRKRNQPTEARVFSEEKLRAEILNVAKSINIPIGMAEPIAREVSRKVAGWIRGRTIITDDDLNMRIAKELQKYNQDLSYVYRNRGRII